MDHKRRAHAALLPDDSMQWTQDESKWAVDYFFLNESEEPDTMRGVLNCVDTQSGATFASIIRDGVENSSMAVHLLDEIRAVNNDWAL